MVYGVWADFKRENKLIHTHFARFASQKACFVIQKPVEGKTFLPPINIT